MEFMVNPIFCVKIFGVIKTLKFLPPYRCVYTKMATPYILTKILKYCSFITHERNALALENLVRCAVLNFPQFYHIDVSIPRWPLHTF